MGVNWCDRCYGAGKVSAGWFKRETCPACDGSGRMKPPPCPVHSPAAPPPKRPAIFVRVQIEQA